MKVFLNRAPVRNKPWGGGAKFFTAFFDHAPEFGIQPTNKLDNDVEAVLLCDPRYDELGVSIDEIISFVRMHPGVKIIHRVNECDARKDSKEMDQLLRFCSKFSDSTVFVSDWIRDYHLSRVWMCNSTCVIVNGVDRETFKPATKLNTGKINLVTAHWSDNPLKGQDIVEWLDRFIDRHSDEFTYTFIGRTQANLKNSVLFSPLFDKALGGELGKFDVCINGSRFDPGPNSVIESVSCGLPTYVHVDGGGSVEFAGVDHVFSSTSELEQLLLNKSFTQNKIGVELTSWKDCIKQYADVLWKSVSAISCRHTQKTLND